MSFDVKSFVSLRTTSHMSISDVYYIPNLIMNLVSVSQLCESSYLVLFSSTSSCLKYLESTGALEKLQANEIYICYG